jgi:hypothetical protein
METPEPEYPEPPPREEAAPPTPREIEAAEAPPTPPPEPEEPEIFYMERDKIKIVEVPCDQVCCFPNRKIIGTSLKTSCDFHYRSSR